jgi:hypothetical protein
MRDAASHVGVVPHIAPLMRATIVLRSLRVFASGAKQSIVRRTRKDGLLRSARNDGDIVSRSRDMMCPRFASRLPSPIRGRREDRVRAAPAVPRAVCALAKDAHEHTGSAEASRPSLRNGFTACFVLFPENGCFASVACAPSRRLDASTAAPEPHDFTVRVGRDRLSRHLRPSHLTARS